ncbi:hypothetical protein M3484_22490 [Pseudomonas sp. GX19020]|uniref:hypothetical protein n=1 Tax=Pseudomonas sp. GX19020 TaxID=2942277 RepID=UPI002019B0A8|nr:hypothetical protein [Pseudomonas sp. GX19020]MCL4069331.1 hypothetical protein [Pseudomonas sp. GX19020]
MDASVGDAAQMATGATTAGTTISTAMTTAGQQVAMQIQQAMTSGAAAAGGQVQAGMQAGGAMAGTQVTVAGTTAGATMQSGVVAGGAQAASTMSNSIAAAGAGGGGGGGFMGLFGGMLIPGILHDGGPVTGATGNRPIPAALYQGAQRYHSGGPVLKAGEVPAILQTGEHVLSRAQVAAIQAANNTVGGGSGAGGYQPGAPVTTNNISMNISTPNADSFRKSQKQIASDMGAATQRAMKSNT